MTKQSNAGMAGPVTPESASNSFGGFRRDDYRLKAVVSRHETELVIAKTQAWAGVWKVVIPVVVLAVVFVCAMVLGVPVPWELALSAMLRAPVH